MTGLILQCASLVAIYPLGCEEGRLGCELRTPVINLCYPEERLETIVAALEPNKNFRVPSIAPEDVCFDYRGIDDPKGQMSLCQVFVDCRRIVTSFGIYGAARFNQRDLDNVVYRIEKRGFYVFVSQMPKTFRCGHQITALPRAIMRGSLFSCDSPELRPFPSCVSDYGIADEILPCCDNAEMKRRQEQREIERLAREMLQGKPFEIQERYYPRAE